MTPGGGNGIGNGQGDGSVPGPGGPGAPGVGGRGGPVTIARTPRLPGSGAIGTAVDGVGTGGAPTGSPGSGTSSEGGFGSPSPPPVFRPPVGGDPPVSGGAAAGGGSATGGEPQATGRSPAAVSPAAEGGRSVGTPSADAGPADPNDPPPKRRPGESGGGNGGGEPDPLGRGNLSLPFLKERNKPRPLRPARLTGGRDWVIYLECKSGSVVLYPSRKEFPVAGLGRAPTPGPLPEAVQAMIDRRQVLVPGGAPPYRPQLRFLVWPDALKTYHATLAALEALAVPKARQNLNPEDDVLDIVTGN